MYQVADSEHNGHEQEIKEPETTHPAPITAIDYTFRDGIPVIADPLSMSDGE